jgi:hypothetical protein
MTDVAKVKLSNVLHTALRGIMVLSEDPASRDMIINAVESDGSVTNVQCLLLILLQWKDDEFVVSSIMNTLVFFTRSREGRRQILQREGVAILCRMCPHVREVEVLAALTSTLGNLSLDPEVAASDRVLSESNLVSEMVTVCRYF